ncbi:hypothetical protein I7I51_09102 [Histoplasma capsulatum]|uniref:Uncharacterized protein n=1 Tax=Ajellomyces capsulatus TaxID=5037 RepID=A0A8A1LZR8_AJECA|nr:hypothetical protein I7I51_09102 [Histoplasma capsulatum]
MSACDGTTHLWRPLRISERINFSFAALWGVGVREIIWELRKNQQMAASDRRATLNDMRVVHVYRSQNSELNVSAAFHQSRRSIFGGFDFNKEQQKEDLYEISLGNSCRKSWERTTRILAYQREFL